MASPELIDTKSFTKSTALLGASSISMPIEEKDIQQLSKWIDTAFEQLQSKDKTRYEDAGYYLLPLILLFILFWFRQGFIAEAWRVS
jgi:ABC-type branched-subunit amino acid transport system permease subunit